MKTARMNRRIVAAAVLGLLGPMAGFLRAEVTAEQVRQAIDRGVQFILEKQRDDGSWPEMIGYRGGVGALCTLALLNAGMKPDNPRMQKSLEYLRSLPPKKTYVVSLQTMVFARAEPDRDRELILRNVKWLERTRIRKTAAPGRIAFTCSGVSVRPARTSIALSSASSIGGGLTVRSFRSGECTIVYARIVVAGSAPLRAGGHRMWQNFRHPDRSRAQRLP